MADSRTLQAVLKAN